MNLKKVLASQKSGLAGRKGQAVVEYIMVFTILTFAIVLVCGGFNLGDRLGNGSTLSIKSVFDRAISGAITEIGR